MKNDDLSKTYDTSFDLEAVQSNNIVKRSLEITPDKVKQTVGFFGDLVSSVGDLLAPIISLFGSKYTTPVVAISSIAKEFGKLNDENLDILQNNVIGFSKLIDIIEDDVSYSISTGSGVIETEKVEAWLIELKSINELRKLNNKILD